LNSVSLIGVLDVAADVKDLGVPLDERGVLFAPVAMKVFASHSVPAAEGEHQLDHLASCVIGPALCVGFQIRHMFGQGTDTPQE
jgi:hypothetical protein